MVSVLLCPQVKGKELDYYGLLGLQHERWMATEAQLKQGEAAAAAAAPGAAQSGLWRRAPGPQHSTCCSVLRAVRPGQLKNRLLACRQQDSARVLCIPPPPHTHIWCTPPFHARACAVPHHPCSIPQGLP
jgi:hypothetical protein